MDLSIFDLEYSVIFLIIIVLLVSSLKKTSEPMPNNCSFFSLNISKSMSVIIKGIACLLILMSHWGQRQFGENAPSTFSYYVWMMGANIALAWFMFLSGYGLSYKVNNVAKNRKECLNEWLKRIGKVYFPLLFVIVISIIFWYVLPDKYSLSELTNLSLPSDIHTLKHLSTTDIPHYLEKVFLVNDWYVRCIIYFYTFFYVANYLSNKTKLDLTLILIFIFSLYLIFAYNYYGIEKAHFFRYPWIFVMGHLILSYSKNKRYTNLLAILFCIVNLAIVGRFYVLTYICAVALLFIFSQVDKRYIIKSRFLMLLGGISYFFYLTHLRLGYVVLTYIGIKSVLLWIIVNLLIALVLNKLYCLIKDFK